MSGSQVNTTNATEEWIEYRSKVLKAFEILEMILFSVEAWIFLSFIVYGTKTRRWKKAAHTSSLSNGFIFIVAAVTMFTCIPRLSVTLVKYNLPYLHEDLCEFVYDFGTGGFRFAASLSYVFLWMRQRLIYGHPYVEPHIPKWINWISILTIILLILDAVSIGFMQITPKSYYVGPLGCSYYKQNDGRGAKIFLLMFFLFTQTVIAGLFVYPANKVLLRQRGGDNQENGASWEATMSSMFCGNTNSPTSPIQMSVRRTMWCGFVMGMSEVVMAVVDIALDLPRIPAIKETVSDAVLVIHTICIVVTFNFSSSVFTCFWPKYQIRVKSKTAQECIP